MHNKCAVYRTLSCRTDEISDITPGVIWVGLSLPRENTNIIGAYFAPLPLIGASLPLCLLAIINICYRTYQRKKQCLVPDIVSQSIIMPLFFLGMVSRWLYSTGGCAK